MLQKNSKKFHVTLDAQQCQRRLEIEVLSSLWKTQH